MAMKLLIVDDESDVREFAANFFRKRKLEVSTASSGEEALKAVESQQPSLVLLDIKMSGMDGIEVLKRIKGLNKRIKVIMITGRNDEEAKKETAKLGAFGYLHKPLELDELMAVVMRMRGGG
jgi:two-component system response regulator (stage 0 sporulation protein F)